LTRIPSCSLWIFVARTDIPFMMHTIPHLVRMSHFPFEERVLVIDTAPLSGDKVNRPGIGSMEDLRRGTAELLEAGVVDRLVDINYDSAYHRRVYQKHFGSPLPFTHNYKGYPILGSVFKIEDCQSDYILHFDSDMLLYQSADYSWIEEGMRLIASHPELMSIQPLPGPPTGEAGKMYQAVPYEQDPDGFCKFKFFGSRTYLINRKRFDELLPLPIVLRSYRNNWLNRLPIGPKTLYSILTKKGSLDSWEIMVSRKLEQSHYFRGALTDPRAWTLHPKDRSPAFIQALPQIIKRIEAGDFPSEQAGYYDLIPNQWY
jgi:hypothetical protein